MSKVREVEQVSTLKLFNVIFRNVANLSEAPVRDTFVKIWTQSNFSDDSIGDFV